MIVLTGCTGALGSRILDHLLRPSYSLSPSDLRLCVRSASSLPRSIQALTSQGLQIFSGIDYHSPATLLEAFSKADKLLLISLPSQAIEARHEGHKNVIDAAKQAGVKHIYYTSLAFGQEPWGGPKSEATVMQAHLLTEEYLRRVGIKFTIIREGVYLDIWRLYLGFFDPKVDEAVTLPCDGKVSFASREDLAEGSVRIIISSSNEYEDKLVTLTGMQAFSLSETTAFVSKLLGREILFRTIGKAEVIQKIEPKVGRSAAEAWESLFQGIGRGETGGVDARLTQLLGRETERLEEFLRRDLEKDGAVMDPLGNEVAKYR